MAFWSSLISLDSGIFTGNGGPITTIADSGGAFNAFNLFPVINNSGVVAFQATRDFGSPGFTNGVYSGDGFTLTTIAADNGAYDGFGTSLGINDSGTVAFRGTAKGSGASTILTGSGGPLSVIASSGGAVNTLDAPDINNNGVLSFHFGLTNGVSGFQRVTSGFTNDIADSTQVSSFSFTSSIKDNGAVIISGFTGSGPFTNGICIVNPDGTTNLIVDSTGPFNSFYEPSLNNNDQIAFKGFLTAGGHGVYTGSDTNADKVLAQGDSLFGSTVSDVSMFRGGLNDSGQIALSVSLQDGRSFILRADPEAVPEPGTGSLLAVAGLALLRLRNRTKHQRSTST